MTFDDDAGPYGIPAVALSGPRAIVVSNVTLPDELAAAIERFLVGKVPETYAGRNVYRAYVAPTEL